jgi:hypothetical protein
MSCNSCIGQQMAEHVARSTLVYNSLVFSVTSQVRCDDDSVVDGNEGICKTRKLFSSNYDETSGVKNIHIHPSNQTFRLRRNHSKSDQQLACIQPKRSTLAARIIPSLPLPFFSNSAFPNIVTLPLQ